MMKRRAWESLNITHKLIAYWSVQCPLQRTSCHALGTQLEHVLHGSYLIVKPMSRYAILGRRSYILRPSTTRCRQAVASIVCLIATKLIISCTVQFRNFGHAIRSSLECQNFVAWMFWKSSRTDGDKRYSVVSRHLTCQTKMRNLSRVKWSLLWEMFEGTIQTKQQQQQLAFQAWKSMTPSTKISQY